MKEVIVNGVRWYRHPYSDVWIRIKDREKKNGINSFYKWKKKIKNTLKKYFMYDILLTIK